MEIGEHPFVTNRSCFPFELVKLAPHEKLVQISQVEHTVIYKKINPTLHIKIIDKLLESSYSSTDVTEFIIRNFGPRKFQIVKSCVLDSK